MSAIRQLPPAEAVPPDHQLPPPEPPSEPPRKSSRIWIPILLILLGAGTYLYLRKNHTVAQLDPGVKQGKGGRGGGAGSEPVLAARARRGNIGVYFNGLGSVTPLNTVTVKSRVDGQLMKVHYLEGDLVHQGDLLIEIDPRPYQVQLEQAEGQFAKDQATLNNARIDLARYETLIKQNAIPEQQLATQRATVEQDEGTVKADQGQIDSAKLNLVYCEIKAPITGKAGLRLVDPGNIVHAADTNGLVVLTQLPWHFGNQIPGT